MSDKLQTLIDSLVAERVESVLAERIEAMLANGSVTAKRADYSNVVRGARSDMARATYLRESGQVDQPMDDQPRRRRSRGRRPRLGYVLVPKRGRQSQPDLFTTAEKVFMAIVKHANKSDDPMSAVQIEAATGLGKKTVESCVYYLRRHDGAGTLVKDGKGLITASPLSAE